MSEEHQEKAQAKCVCPLCAAWSAYQDSEVARHLRAMHKEGLLAVRSGLDWCIGRAETVLKR